MGNQVLTMSTGDAQFATATAGSNPCPYQNLADAGQQILPYSKTGSTCGPNSYVPLSTSAQIPSTSAQVPSTSSQMQPTITPPPTPPQCNLA
ncbi:hypothetical protein P7C71_g447, partial [Lecanoromycetidae sp. Uapishka_2]